MKKQSDINVSPEETERQHRYAEAVRRISESGDVRPKAYIETYGCQQNTSDSERLMGMLCDMGYETAESKDEADLILYNTCAVRENAELRVFGNLGALKHRKRRDPELLIGVCGCMMQQKHIADTIKAKYKHVDMVFGTHALYRFPSILYEALTGSHVIDIEGDRGEICEDIPVRRGKPPLAKVPIMYGCNNFCTYCIVPYVRGRERSRSADAVLSECRSVAEQGYREVMLLGQNVNSYGNDSGSISFARLLREVCKIDGIERVRFMTSHPKDLSDELIDAIAEEKKICDQLHLPLQSGSDRILKAMNRGYTREKYMERLRRVKERIPGIVITTDIIVGFPGETNEDFAETLSALKEAEYDMIFSFIYSKRKGTPAASMPDCITDEEKHRNFDEMLRVQNEISRRKNDAYLGRTVSVLVEGKSKNNENAMTGRTEGGKVVNFVGDDIRVGSLIDVKITEAQTWSLMGHAVYTRR